jgi:hypothetical protein
MKLLDLLFGKRDEPEEDCAVPEHVLSDLERRNERTERRLQALREEHRFDEFQKGNDDGNDTR